MKIRICRIFWGLLLLFLMGNIPLSAQLQFPGKALGIKTGLKAADVLYVLPPPDYMEIEEKIIQSPCTLLWNAL